MSLPIAGGGGRGPRIPTHKALDFSKMMRCGVAVDEAADDAPITADALEELALEEGVDVSHLYAAAAVTTDVQFAREHEVAFTVCGGNCQHWGALECLETLADIRRERIEDGKSGFDIQAKKCLDQCDLGPVVVVHTPGGKALLEKANKSALAAAVAEICD